MMQKIFLYWQTLKYLKLSQIYYQIKKRLIPYTKVSTVIKHIEISIPHRQFVQPIIKNSSLEQYNDANPRQIIINFLNYSSDYQCDIWNDSNKEKLWLYNLHYFDYLSSNNNRTLAVFMLKEWLLYNLPFYGVGWEPYPTSLRIVNLIKSCLYFNDFGELDPQVNTSLYLQARFLAKNLEFHILGNHLLANIKALIFCGVYFNTDESSNYLHYALQLLDEQLAQQVLADGGHFELSPMYHNIIVEDMLDIINILQTYQPHLNKLDSYRNITTKMLKWSKNICHPDGQIAFFNDCAFNIAACYTDLARYANTIFGYIDEVADINSDKVIDNNCSGLIRIRHDDITVFIDVAAIGARYLTGHAHADTLSFELSIARQRIFVNPGCYSYQNTLHRQFIRSTKAHNTVEINSSNSSEVWGNFRTGRRANPLEFKLDTYTDTTVVSCAHDGYAQLLNKNIIHKRIFTVTAQELIIEDQVSGEPNATCCYFHLSPELNIKILTPKSVNIVTIDGKLINVIASNVIKVINMPYFEQFGVELTHQVLVIHFEHKHMLRVKI